MNCGVAWLTRGIGFVVGGADLVLCVVKVAGQSGNCCDGNRLSKISAGGVLSVRKEDRNVLLKFG